MITMYKKCIRYITLTALVVFVAAINCACSQLFSVKAPYADSDCIGRNYDVVRLDFAEAGFDNIEIIALKDLNADESELNGAVVSVTVDDLATFDEKTSFEYSSKVIIKYHSYKQVGIPVSYEEAKTIDASELETAFREAGFVNITLQEKRDLDPATMTSEFENRVSIGGLENFSKNDTYTVDSEIVIVTHRAREEFKLELVIDFEENLIFSRYGVTIEIGGKTESLSHGKDGNFKYTLERGKYKLTFSKKDSKSIKTTVEIDLSGNTKAAYKISCHSDKISVKTLYVENQGKVGEGEAMIPVSAADCEYENYKDIENKFKKAGFTNIKTKILYDIVWGITQEGEVEKVSVNGKTSFKRGDVFAKDAEIIITYHMKEEDDPSNFIIMEKFYYDYWGEDYKIVKQQLINLGFSESNITFTEEITTSNSKKDGEVKSIYVNGDQFAPGDKYSKDAKATVCYWKKADLSRYVEMTNDISYYTGKNYESVEQDFLNMGFTNVSVLYENYYGESTDDGVVFNIYVNGKEYQKGELIHKNSEIKIYYWKVKNIVLPKAISKLGFDLEISNEEWQCYLNVDGISNVPTLKKWGTVIVTDGVAEYLDYLTEKGYTVTIVNYLHKEPWDGFNTYDTEFKVSKNNVIWTMSLSIEDELYTEYEFYIYLT